MQAPQLGRPSGPATVTGRQSRAARRPARLSAAASARLADCAPRGSPQFASSDGLLDLSSSALQRHLSGAGSAHLNRFLGAP